MRKPTVSNSPSRFCLAPNAARFLQRLSLPLRLLIARPVPRACHARSDLPQVQRGVLLGLHGAPPPLPSE